MLKRLREIFFKKKDSKEVVEAHKAFGNIKRKSDKKASDKSAVSFKDLQIDSLDASQAVNLSLQQSILTSDDYSSAKSGSSNERDVSSLNSHSHSSSYHHHESYSDYGSTSSSDW